MFLYWQADIATSVWFIFQRKKGEPIKGNFFKTENMNLSEVSRK